MLRARTGTCCKVGLRDSTVNRRSPCASHLYSKSSSVSRNCTSVGSPWIVPMKSWSRSRRRGENHGVLNVADARRDVQDNNARLFRAYLLDQTLASALDYLQPKRARRALDDWLSWACRSKLAPFVRVSRTIRAKKEGVLAYIQGRLTNGIVEGTNNRLRMIARRAFGFHSADALISMLYLCCGGIELHPPLPQRHFDFRNP